VKELLPESFYGRDALTVARDLLGAVLVRDQVALRITEVEAYLPGDTAAHSRAGRTPRTSVLFGPPGRAYVYLCYGLHNMLNLVTGPDGEPSAVLIRSAEPVAGLDLVRERRGGKSGPVLLTGPGKVGAALGLDTRWTGHRVFELGDLEVRAGDPVASALVGPRVGVDYADPVHRDAPWRFAIAGTPWVSHRAGLVAEPRRMVRNTQRSGG
jgi:DNA-3-methyladenine glycosylase